MECGEGLPACAKALGQTLLEEHRGGLCVCSRVGRGGQGGEESQGGDGQVVQGLVGLGEDMGFFPRELGALEGCGQRRGGA